MRGRRTPVPWAWQATQGIVLLAAVLALPALWVAVTGSKAAESTVSAVYTSTVLVVALQMFSGNSGIISFGHLAFAGVGAYCSSLLTLSPTLKGTLGLSLPGPLMDSEMGLLAALAITVVVAAAIALLTSGVILRLAGTSAVIAIFALLLISNVVFSGWTAVTHGAGGLYGVPRETTLGLAFLAAVAAVAIARYYKDSRLGLGLRASREHELAAASIGVAVRRQRVLAWVLSAVVSAVGGALMAHHLTAFSPATFFLAPTFVIVVMLVVGGMGTVGGAVLGGMLVTFVQEVLRGVEGTALTLGPISIERLTGLTQVALVAMILIVLYASREGLLSRREPDELIRRWRRRSASAPAVRAAALNQPQGQDEKGSRPQA